jgi:hypothetical protein
VRGRGRPLTRSRAAAAVRVAFERLQQRAEQHGEERGQAHGAERSSSCRSIANSASSAPPSVAARMAMPIAHVPTALAGDTTRITSRISNGGRDARRARTRRRRQGTAAIGPHWWAVGRRSLLGRRDPIPGARHRAPRLPFAPSAATDRTGEIRPRAAGWRR